MSNQFTNVTNNLIVFENEGPLLIETNYWLTDHARNGFCWITANAGALRFLLPKPSEYLIKEILTGKSVTIEPSIVIKGYIDIVFEDGTPAPFNLAMSPRAMDFNPQKLGTGCDIPFTVYTEGGILCSLRAKARFEALRGLK